MEEKAKFDGIFESLLPINGLLSGDKVKPVLMNSKLPLDVLGRVSGSLPSCKATEFCRPCARSPQTLTRLYARPCSIRGAHVVGAIAAVRLARPHGYGSWMLPTLWEGAVMAHRTRGRAASEVNSLPGAQGWAEVGLEPSPGISPSPLCFQGEVW